MKSNTAGNAVAEKPQTYIIRYERDQHHQCCQSFAASSHLGTNQHRQHQQQGDAKAQKQGANRHRARRANRHGLSLFPAKRLTGIHRYIDDFLFRLSSMATRGHLTGCAGRSLKYAHPDESFLYRLHNALMAYLTTFQFFNFSIFQFFNFESACKGTTKISK